MWWYGVIEANNGRVGRKRGPRCTVAGCAGSGLEPGAEGVGQVFPAGQRGLDATHADRGLEVDGNAVFVVRDPDEKVGPFLERLGIAGGQLAGELQAPHGAGGGGVDDLAAQELVFDGADRVDHHQVEPSFLADLHVAGRGHAPQVEKVGHGVEVGGRDVHGASAFVSFFEVLAEGVDQSGFPVEGQTAAVTVAALLDLGGGQHGAQGGLFEPGLVDVVHLEKDGVEGLGQAVGVDAVAGDTVEFVFRGAEGDGGHVGGQYGGAVTGGVGEFFAGLEGGLDRLGLSRGAVSHPQQDSQDREECQSFHGRKN